MLLVVAAILLMAAMAVPAFAHSGPQLNEEPIATEVSFVDLNTIQSAHDETVNNPEGWYKGWWWVNITNNTAAAWSSITINAGAGDLVAIVEGNGLEDEWGFVGNSVVSNKAGTFAYSGSLGAREYENGADGTLWNKAEFTFSTPLPVGQKASFRIYTDNSYYEGPYASSFCVCLTPTAVPEPSSLLALAGGILGIGGVLLRKRR